MYIGASTIHVRIHFFSWVVYVWVFTMSFLTPSCSFELFNNIVSFSLQFFLGKAGGSLLWCWPLHHIEDDSLSSLVVSIAGREKKREETPVQRGQLLKGERSFILPSLVSF